LGLWDDGVTSGVEFNVMPSTISNRRTQRRIGVNIKIGVFFPGRKEPVDAMSQDLSWGGAQFVGRLPVSDPRGRIRLLFPWRGEDKVSIDADVVRAQRLASGDYQVAVRFASLSPRNQGRLDKLLTMLDLGDKSGDKAESPLVLELEVDVPDATSMREMLQQIAGGSLRITVQEGYQAGQSIRLSLRGAGDLPSVKLRARVSSVEPFDAGGFAAGGLSTLELGFEHPANTIKAFVDLLVAQLPEAPPQPPPVPDAPPVWVPLPLAHPSEPLWLDAEDTSSVLESQFPDALIGLQRGWGDPEAFDVTFRELTMGSLAEPGGWPKDAWDELGFLQDVHDLAYGLPKSRDGVLRATRCR
jgi:hypothetical protein